MFSQCSTHMISRAVLQRSSRVVANRFHNKSSSVRRWMTTETKETVKEAVTPNKEKTSWWSDAKFWGGLGALAGWGMSGSAIYDAALQGPEVISLTMTPVLIVYSTLFARWAYVVTPPNPLLMYCHIANVAAQLNQLRRALEYKMQNGEEEKVKELMTKVAVGGAVTAVAVAAGPRARTALAGAGLGVISTVAAGT
jgi:Mitochondrial pyruvate carriers